MRSISDASMEITIAVTAILAPLCARLHAVSLSGFTDDLDLAIVSAHGSRITCLQQLVGNSLVETCCLDPDVTFRYLLCVC